MTNKLSKLMQWADKYIEESGEVEHVPCSGLRVAIELFVMLAIVPIAISVCLNVGFDR
ncbi:hypothetical protein [Burkholderia sp. PU8-34]